WRPLQRHPAGSGFGDRAEAVVDLEAAALRPHLYVDRISGRLAGVNDQIDRSFIELESGCGSRISVRQVVPGPAVAERLIFEEIVVTDNPPFDSPHSRISHLFCERSHDSTLVAAFADARIPA